MLDQLFKIIAVCHTIEIDPEANDQQDALNAEVKLVYNAESPDELALVNGARYFGIVFTERDSSGHIVIRDDRSGQVEKFKLLNVIEFTSARKRMSILVK